MQQLGARTVVCEESLGRVIKENDTTLASRFNSLALKDRVAVFQLK
jgi:hypothetical protein